MTTSNLSLDALRARVEKLDLQFLTDTSEGDGYDSPVYVADGDKIVFIIKASEAERELGAWLDEREGIDSENRQAMLAECIRRQAERVVFGPRYDKGSVSNKWLVQLRLLEDWLNQAQKEFPITESLANPDDLESPTPRLPQPAEEDGISDAVAQSIERAIGKRATVTVSFEAGDHDGALDQAALSLERVLGMLVSPSRALCRFFTPQLRDCYRPRGEHRDESQHGQRIRRTVVR